MGDVHGLPLQSGSLKRHSGYDIFASSSTSETDIRHFHGPKIGPDEMECNDGETTIVKFCLQDFCISYFIHGGKGLVWLICW